MSSREHIIGVAVSDISSEIAMAIESVTANSRNRRPTIPVISRMGINTATSDMLMVTTVEPISSAPFSVACMARPSRLPGAG